jgi:hypothetical protein
MQKGGIDSGYRKQPATGQLPVISSAKQPSSWFITCPSLFAYNILWHVMLEIINLTYILNIEYIATILTSN